MTKIELRRKLNKIGGSLLVSVPDPIVKTSHLEVGDTIVWIINNDKLEVKFE